MSIVGVSASKGHLYLAETTAEEDGFTVHRHDRITIDSGSWSSPVTDLSAILESYNGA